MRFLTITAAVMLGVILARPSHQPVVASSWVNPNRPDQPFATTPEWPTYPVVTPTIVWRDYDSGMTEAANTNKPSFVYVRSATCPWCDRLEKEFTDPQVIALINAGYVPIQVSAEQRPDLVVGLQVQSFPTMAVYASDRTFKWIRAGYKDAVTIKALLTMQTTTAPVPIPQMTYGIQTPWNQGYSSGCSSGNCGSSRGSFRGSGGCRSCGG